MGNLILMALLLAHLPTGEAVKEFYRKHISRLKCILYLMLEDVFQCTGRRSLGRSRLSKQSKLTNSDVFKLIIDRCKQDKADCCHKVVFLNMSSKIQDIQTVHTVETVSFYTRYY